MAWADTTRKAEAQGGGLGSLAVTINNTVAGNMVVVGCSVYGNGTGDPNSAGSDGANTWSQVFSRVQASGSERQEAALLSSVLGTGGNRTITVDPGSGTYDYSLFAHEFSGTHATPASGTPVTNSGGSGTSADTTAFTPADPDTLYIAVLGNSASGTITENVSPGDTNWTLSNDHESGSAAEPGSMVFYILSGSAASRRAAWTIPTGTFWAAGIGAFKPAASSAAQLEGLITAALTMSADLTTAIEMASLVSANGDVAADLTTQILMEALSLLNGDMLAELTTAIEMAAQVSAAGNVQAEITTEILMEAGMSAGGTVTADLSVGAAPLEGVIGCSAGVSADLTTAIEMAALIAGSAQSVADLQTAIEFEAIMTSNGLVAADLVTAIQLEGNVLGEAFVSADLTGGTPPPPSFSGGSPTKPSMIARQRMLRVR